MKVRVKIPEAVNSEANCMALLKKGGESREKSSVRSQMNVKEKTGGQKREKRVCAGSHATRI